MLNDKNAEQKVVNLFFALKESISKLQNSIIYCSACGGSGTLEVDEHDNRVDCERCQGEGIICKI